MEFFKYANDMLALGTIPAYVSLALIAFFVLCAAWYAFRGFRRGITRQLLHSAFTLVSVGVSWFASNDIWATSLNALDGHSLSEFIELSGAVLGENIEKALTVFDIQVAEYILLLPVGVVVMPAIFMVLFFIVYSALNAACLVVSAMLRLGRSESIVMKLLGLAVGIVEGVAIASVILIPVAGVSAIADETYVLISESNEEHGLEETKLEKLYVEYVKPVSDNPVIKLLDSIGGDALLDGLASFEDGDVDMNMRDEFASMVKLGLVDALALSDTNWVELNESDKIHIEEIIESVAESDYKATVVSEMLSCMGQLVGATKPEGVENDGTSEVILALFDIFVGLDRDNLDEVLNSFKDFYFLASDEGILKGFAEGDRAQLTEALVKKDAGGKTTLARMVDILNSNEKTSVLVRTLTDMTFTILCDSMGVDSDVIAKYNSVKGSLNSTLAAIDPSKTKEEQIASVSDSLAESFAANGMNVEEGAIDNMASYIVENHADGEELTEDDFNDIMLNYYQANSDHLNSSAE